MIRAGVEIHLPAEDAERAILFMMVTEWTHPGVDPSGNRHPRVLEAGIDVILPAYAEADPPALRDNDARGPDFHVEFVHLARRERLLFVVGVEGPVGQRAPGVKLSVRGAQPAVADGVCGSFEP